MKIFKSLVCIALFVASTFVGSAQTTVTTPGRCGTMELLEAGFKSNPGAREKFEAEKSRFNQAVRLAASKPNANRAFLTVPVVFHIVLEDPTVVTAATIQAQLDTLNKDYAGTNGDAVKVPSYFKSVFGQSGIQFCLAKQTPDGDSTTGVERIVSRKIFSAPNTNLSPRPYDSVKHKASGGADAWDPNNYLNVWICHLSNGTVGYSTFPGDATVPANDQGVAIDVISLPSTQVSDFNGGKTLTHEIGHYFNLFHIWGNQDKNTNCSNSDDVDDTPNQYQSTPSNVCPSPNQRYDQCQPSGNGVMYENYMDYTADNCLVMFTIGQVARMETAFTMYRGSLANSIGCQPPVYFNLDAQLVSVNQPTLQRVCSNPFTPVVTIKNRGAQVLTSLTITTLLDNTTIANTPWTGSLARQVSADVTLAAVTPTPGNHILKVYISKPNNGTDQSTVNDSLTITFQYNNPVTALTESFEAALFPPTGWDIVNPDGGITWKKAAGIAKTGSASVVINNYNVDLVGQQDYLRLPDINLTGIDSAFFSFQVAAAAYTNITTANNVWDTLEVLLSKDCGLTYTSLYKKWGPTLVTHTTALTSSFVPAAGEWRKDSVNLTSYIGSTVLLAFKNTNGNENNIYIDDVNLKTVVVNPNLKSKGFLVTPSPTKGNVIVQFYPQPTNVKSIQIYNMNGQKVAETLVNGQSNYYALDISRYSAGAYIVRAVMGDAVITKKIIKY